MRKIEHWNGTRLIEIAESKGGVLATLDPWTNLVRGGARLWPPPELVQKAYANDRWVGKTEAGTLAPTEGLRYYCDLQSLNSEDAITWSFFGPLIYGLAEWREEFATGLFSSLGLAKPTAILWHPHLALAPDSTS